MLLGFSERVLSLYMRSLSREKEAADPRSQQRTSMRQGNAGHTISVLLVAEEADFVTPLEYSSHYWFVELGVPLEGQEAAGLDHSVAGTVHAAANILDALG